MSDSISLSTGLQSGAGGKPCRLVRHTLNDGSHHYDLFIDLDGISSLATLEIQIDHSDIHYIDPSIKDSGNPIIDFFIEESLESFQLVDRPILGRIIKISGSHKNDHRRIYMEYEGMISGDRGELRHIASGNFWGSLNIKCISIPLIAVIQNNGK